MFAMTRKFTYFNNLLQRCLLCFELSNFKTIIFNQKEDFVKI
jgi:hypothetical protein